MIYAVMVLGLIPLAFLPDFLGGHGAGDDLGEDLSNHGADGDGTGDSHVGDDQSQNMIRPVPGFEPPAHAQPDLPMPPDATLSGQGLTAPELSASPQAAETGELAAGEPAESDDAMPEETSAQPPHGWERLENEGRAEGGHHPEQAHSDRGDDDEPDFGPVLEPLDTADSPGTGTPDGPVLEPFDEPDQPGGGTVDEAEILRPIDQIDTPVDDMWVTAGEDGQVAHVEVDDFEHGRDVLRIGYLNHGEGHAPSIEVRPDEHGENAHVFIDGSLFAILKGASGATADDVIVETPLPRS